MHRYKWRVKGNKLPYQYITLAGPTERLKATERINSTT
ncbi:hypothetical protein GLIP_2047 [Aliiglaciecola lipolytica E3]|uniref:Uncharacterized protein n=1 Tax=Aliiglaciecola lipolytica E3 TaxID=1127673 RepID=K6YTR1_9ALTE|nr:hypothetical protein GLIP_2047 [Aliiglaciecola lipolytica E3]